MVKLGIVGAGVWGSMHAQAYAQHPSAQLVAICDLDRERAEQLAARFGAAHVFTDLDRMLDLGLDGLSVATPDTAHAEIAIRAAERGVHILVEKPLATTIAECEQMICAAERAGVWLMVDWHNRWNPPCYYAWRAIRQGEIGEVRYVYYRLSDTVYVPTQMLAWAERSSVMWFLGSHALDTTCWWVGRPPLRVYCQKRSGMLNNLGVHTPDLYVTLVDFEGGALAVIENTWILPQQSPSLIDHQGEILGAQGALYVDATHNRSLAQYSPATAGGFPHPSFPDLFVTPEIYGRQKGFAVESIYHFIECIRDNRPPLATGQDGLLNTRLILAAEQSARTGLPVDVTP